jgi:TPR repeat protein
LAAEHDNARGQFLLAEMLDRPASGRTNLAETLKWYRRAVDQGHTEAQYKLAGIYASGDGEPRNEDDIPQRLYELAAEQSHTEACQQLSGRFHEGYAVPRDYVKAAYWTRRQYVLEMESVNRGKLSFFDEQRYLDPLGRLLQTKDPGNNPGDTLWRQIVQLFCLAVDRQDAEARVAIAQAYLSGRGVPVDTVEAYAWLSVAGRSGQAQELTASVKARLSKEDLKRAVDRASKLIDPVKMPK